MDLCNPDESQRKYSSTYANDKLGTGHARSMLDSKQAWSAGACKKGEYMIIDLGSVHVVGGVITQGRGDSQSDQYVTAFKVEHCINHNIGVWLPIKKTFNAGKGDDKKGNFFDHAVVARYLKFKPQTWNAYCSMRAGAFLCKPSWPSTGSESQESLWAAASFLSAARTEYVEGVKSFVGLWMEGQSPKVHEVFGMYEKEVQSGGEKAITDLERKWNMSKATVDTFLDELGKVAQKKAAKRKGPQLPDGVTKDVALHFLVALKEEYVLGQGGAVGGFMDTIPPETQQKLNQHEEFVQHGDNKRLQWNRLRLDWNLSLEEVKAMQKKGEEVESEDEEEEEETPVTKMTGAQIQSTKQTYLTQLHLEYVYGLQGRVGDFLEQHRSLLPHDMLTELEQAEGEVSSDVIAECAQTIVELAERWEVNAPHGVREETEQGRPQPPADDPMLLYKFLECCKESSFSSNCQMGPGSYAKSQSQEIYEVLWVYVERHSKSRYPESWIKNRAHQWGVSEHQGYAALF
eukprot:TRINITY_DN6523_c0_g1_i1.p1 TRINITY_DN6523_c0_g1~~TRINITY_DN6523_c0_g1_i1.p1  ORF type:complete len:605 (+),score=79.97 TRINITY_DN6523_c0_g1_i1:268-1815(+)